MHIKATKGKGFRATVKSQAVTETGDIYHGTEKTYQQAVEDDRAILAKLVKAPLTSIDKYQKIWYFMMS